MDRVWSERTWAGAAREAHQRHPNKSVRHRGRECRPRPGAKPPLNRREPQHHMLRRPRPGAGAPARRESRSTRLRAEAGPEPEQRPRHAIRLIE